MTATGRGPTNLKGVRGYRAIARRRWRGQRRRRLAAPPVGRCAAWVQLPRLASRSARLSTRAAGPGDLLLQGGSSLIFQNRTTLKFSFERQIWICVRMPSRESSALG
jgi:hypothetical protein